MAYRPIYTPGIMGRCEKAVRIFDQRAEDYQSRFMDVSLYRASFDSFYALLSPGAEVLELACGPGNITKYLTENRPDLKILATDLSPNMLKLARINCPKAAFELLDMRHLGRLGKKFDAVLCGFGLPYLSKTDAIKLISAVAKSLKPKGVLYLSAMEGDYAEPGLKKSSDGTQEIFIHFHQADYLSGALLDLGFSLETLKRQDFPQPDGNKATDLIIIARLK